MPAQDRARGDQAMAAQRSRQPPDEGGEHGPVRPVQARSWVGAAEHRDLVPQHQQLDVLGGGRAAQQQDQPEHVLEDQVQQPQRHGGDHARPLATTITAGQGMCSILEPRRVRRPLQRPATASGAAAAAATPNIAGSPAGSWRDPASTSPGRTHQRVRDRSLKPLVRLPGRVLEPRRGSPGPTAARVPARVARRVVGSVAFVGRSSGGRRAGRASAAGFSVTRAAAGASR